jgi:bile acid:Na+ symporter, BASS family
MMLGVLAWFGRHGTALMAAGIVTGLAVPPLAHLLGPILPGLIFFLTVATLLRIDWPQVLAHARHPGRIALAVAWFLVATPVLMLVAVRAFDLPPSLSEALVLWAASSPLVSSPAIAMLLGLDGALALVVMASSTLLMPVILPPLVLGLIGMDIGLGLVPLMLRLILFVGGAVLLAVLLRRWLGWAWLQRHVTELNGVNVLTLLVFAIAVMDGMWQRLTDDPQTVLLYAGCAMAASIGCQALSVGAFAWLDRPQSFTIGLLGGNKALALVYASMAGKASPDLGLFFACQQLPIYLLPALLAPIYRRLGAQLSA